MATARRGAMVRPEHDATVVVADARRASVEVPAPKGAARGRVVLNVRKGVLGIAATCGIVERRPHRCQSSMWHWCPMIRVWILWLARFG